VLLNSNYSSAETYKGQVTDVWEHEFLVVRIHKEASSLETLQDPPMTGMWASLPVYTTSIIMCKSKYPILT
jgi:hypothetical protein